MSNVCLRIDYQAVPRNFPRPKPVLVASDGSVTDVALEEYDGMLFAPGCSPPAIWGAWQVCEELAQHIATEINSIGAGADAHLSREKILEQHFWQAKFLDWGEDNELNWVIFRTAELLGWPIPDCIMQR